MIKEIKIFDVYEGENIPSDKKSIALKVTLQSDHKTLNENDQVEFETARQDTLETNENAELIIELANNGEGNAQGIEVFLELSNYSGGLEINGLKITHKLIAGDSKKIIAKIFATEMMISEKVSISAYITEHFGHDIVAPQLISLNTKSLTSPEIVLSDININDQNKLDKINKHNDVISSIGYHYPMYDENNHLVPSSERLMTEKELFIQLDYERGSKNLVWNNFFVEIGKNKKY